MPAIAAGAHAAEVKGTSRIDAVTVYPSGAEVTRIGKVKLERGEHTLLFTDLPANAVSSSIRVEGKATGKLEIGSVDTRSVSVPRADDAVAATERRRVEDAIEKLKDDKAALQASVSAAETQKTADRQPGAASHPAAPAHGAAAPQPDWGQLFGLIGERAAEAQKTILDTQVKMRDVDRQIKDLEGKLASLAPTQQARTEVKVSVNAGASAGGRHRHPLPGGKRVMDALLRCAPDDRHQGAGAEAAAGAPRVHPAAHRRSLGQRGAGAVDGASCCRHGGAAAQRR